MFVIHETDLLALSHENLLALTEANKIFNFVAIFEIFQYYVYKFSLVMIFCMDLHHMQSSQVVFKKLVFQKKISSSAELFIFWWIFIYIVIFSYSRSSFSGELVSYQGHSTGVWVQTVDLFPLSGSTFCCK